MEDQQFRPRIQDAFRTEKQQLADFNAGHSKVKFGFHNIAGPGGDKEALACDVLDDDHPSGPPTKYLLALAVAARAEGLVTGILWGLKTTPKAATNAAIAAGDIGRKVKVGFDPTHIEPVGITIAQAKKGKRPAFDGQAVTVTVAGADTTGDDMPLTQADADLLVKALTKSAPFKNAVAKFVWEGNGGAAVGSPSFQNQVRTIVKTVIDGQPVAQLSEAEVARIADAVVARLAPAPAAGRRGGRGTP
jgi:hypothetical protein